jgi:GT2 family glycosyltransferase
VEPLVKLSVIIVSYNSQKTILDAVSSLVNPLPSFPIEVIVVDNASTDETCSLIRNRFPEVKLIVNEHNLGFARANNIGAAEAEGEFLLFLNPDARLTLGALPLMLSRMEEDKRIGGLGPALFSPDGRYELSYGFKPGFMSELYQKVASSLLSGDSFFPRLLASRKRPAEQEVSWLTAAALLLRRKAFRQVAGFDERFFLYFEDVDLSLRMRKAGFSLIYFPEAVVIHIRGGSTGYFPLSIAKEYRRSQLYFYGKYYGGGRFFLLKLYLLVKFLFGLVLSALRLIEKKPFFYIEMMSFVINYRRG